MTFPSQAAEHPFDVVWRTICALATSSANIPQVRTPSENEKRLVRDSLHGNANAFGRIVESHQTAISAQMRRFSRDERVIEELTHDVFVEAYLSLKSFRGDSPLIHWLRKIAVRVGYRYWKLKAKTRAQTVSLSDIAAQVEQVIGDSGNNDRCDASELLGNLLESLPPRDRLVLTLIYWDGCSVSEAAELSGWSQSMIKVQAYRARKRLQRMIEDSQ